MIKKEGRRTKEKFLAAPSSLACFSNSSIMPFQSDQCALFAAFIETKVKKYKIYDRLYPCEIIEPLKIKNQVGQIFFQVLQKPTRVQFFGRAQTEREGEREKEGVRKRKK